MKLAHSFARKSPHDLEGHASSIAIGRRTTSFLQGTQIFPSLPPLLHIGWRSPEDRTDSLLQILRPTPVRLVLELLVLVDDLHLEFEEPIQPSRLALDQLLAGFDSLWRYVPVRRIKTRGAEGIDVRRRKLFVA